uniref:dual specificity protein kinase pyk3-like n=1 Tax=Erigeron canadensis TaxID=72917 RepID=UPI001CB9606A|nr:dual specificity protein kinase pyk3-like [Erigeron canadensis]
MSFDSSDGMESSTSTSTYTSTTQWLPPCHKFVLREILLATENFNEYFVIGKGGFGKVYKGEVIVGTHHVAAAIKRLDLRSNQGAVEFWAEVEMLSKLRHSHLVSLIGYCNHEREMILVYEYMPNGTLEDHLHKLRTRLSWVDRLKICIGAARGLDYLHTGTGIEFGVIHRDVKCSNILLHESWAAKISDFGLSRIGPTNQPRTYVDTFVKGTFGYFDPNYFATGQLTRKSDVYAFGVVLLEVLCQKRPLDRSLEYGLATWAKESIKEGNLKNIVDSNIRNEIFPKCLKEFARIAVRCLEYHPKDRPTMTEVIFSLESVLTLQLQTPRKSLITRMVGVLQAAKMQKQVMHMERSLERNAALALEDQLQILGAMNTFSAKTLELATQSYASNMIIGKGGYATVYKGILPDNRVVAIKKIRPGYESWKSSEERFLNEVVILSKINHQNVVQVLGCCMETEVPLLVYEYVPNGTLHDHIHNKESGRKRLAWDSRLRIAYDTASALAYLHTDTIMSTIHRDVKPSMILLDENLTAKIAGFGVSRLIPEDCDHVSTLVIGTFGYLDPEYLQTGELRHKIDVYSFGVVLAELLTGINPLTVEKAEEESYLVRDFLNVMLENQLTEIVDHQVLKEATDEQLKAACDLACRCLARKSENRPSMKEVAMELETIKKLGENHPIVLDNYMEPHSLVVESEQVDLHSDISENNNIYENHNDSNFSDILRNNDICFNDNSIKPTAVIWNPSLGKSIAVDVPYLYADLGFAVRPDNCDPVIVLINSIGHPIPVLVFTLSSRVWRVPRGNLPPKLTCFGYCSLVTDDQRIYWKAYTTSINLVVTYDMVSEDFTEIQLPHSVARRYFRNFSISKIKESLALLDYDHYGDRKPVCNVWMMVEDGASKSFTKVFTKESLPNFVVSSQ